MKKIEGKCFRPLSGSRYFKFGCRDAQEITVPEFPSPFGVSLFQIRCKLHKGFRKESFRPLSGSRYFKCNHAESDYEANPGFRPLSGSRYFK